jgi:microcystin-dependent protein
MGTAGRPVTTVEGFEQQFGGQALQHLTVGQLPPHTHDISHAHTITGAASGTVGTSIVQLIDPVSVTANVPVNNPLTIVSNPTGNGDPVPVLDPYLAVTFIIRVQSATPLQP